MTTIVLPLDAAAGSPSFSAQATRQAFSALAGAAPSGRPLGATSGVRPGTPSTTVTATGFTWSCAAHSGVLDVQASAAAGPYLYATDGTDTGSITAANGTNPRVDIIYVQVNDNVQDSSGSEGGLIGYLAGTPAASPVAPNPPNSRCMVLANISVPISGQGNPSVSWVAPRYGDASSSTMSASGLYTGTATAYKLPGGMLAINGSVNRGGGGNNATLHTTGIVFPAGFRPVSAVYTAPAPFWGAPSSLYRFQWGTDGTLNIQESAAVAPAEGMVINLIVPRA